MDDTDQTPHLDLAVPVALSAVPKSYVPATLKALDRLVGAAVGIPVALLEQKRLQIEARTKSLIRVENSVGAAAAQQAAKDDTVVNEAVHSLLKKEYRRSENKVSVAQNMLDELRVQNGSPSAQSSTEQSNVQIDDDWLNVFERYAEDASSERVQRLWGRVLAGEIRKPGRYSVRTLRFLSEFSQDDGLSFSEICKSAFGYFVPRSLAKPNNETNIKDLIFLESSGLVYGVTGTGVLSRITFDQKGYALIPEDNIGILLKGQPGSGFSTPVCPITPLGQELLSLLPQRDAAAAARRVAEAIRGPEISSAFLAKPNENRTKWLASEIIWQDQNEELISHSS